MRQQLDGLCHLKKGNPRLEKNQERQKVTMIKATAVHRPNGWIQ